ncbi:MAG: retroviral-like aspartic protease family protein, partial [Isosphaeraceae bacterium]
RPTGDGPLLTLPVLLDTAADFTVIPWRVVDELQLLQHDEVEAVVFGGQATLVTSFIIQLQIHELEPLNVEALASREEPHVLLGRDVLNAQRIVLDGPELVLEIG